MTLHDTDLDIEALRPGDDGYDDAANVFFGTGAPALIVRPGDVHEVAEALEHARKHGLPVSVRSGGHSPVGHSTNTDGMVIDLARLDAVEVLDPERRLVRVGGGATWGTVAGAIQSRGWGLTSGDTENVGVGGLTLGGGIGWMVRRHGLTIDNLVSARVVTADARVITASPDEDAELFWALRGGGGNFGVVVDFDFVAQEVETVHYGTVTYRLDDRRDIVRRWRDAMRGAPDELSSTLVLAPAFPGAAAAAMVLVCYAGEPGSTAAEADAAIEPLLELGTVTAAKIEERPYADILEHAQHPPGIRMVSRNTLVREVDDQVVDAIDRLHAAPVPTAVAIRALGGAFGRVPADATAFAHRDAEAMIVCALFVPATTSEADIDRALAPWREVAALGTGTYVSFQGSATPEDVAAAYPPATYTRLADVKRAYDPGNVFALNHNVEPARSEEADGPAA